MTKEPRTTTCRAGLFCAFDKTRSDRRRVLAGSSATDAFDADLGTAFAATSSPVDGSYLSRTFEQPVSLHQVEAVGTGVGELQVEHDGTWSTVGRMATGSSHAQGSVDPSWQVTGVRILFQAGSPEPVVDELITR